MNNLSNISARAIEEALCQKPQLCIRLDHGSHHEVIFLVVLTAALKTHSGRVNWRSMEKGSSIR